MSPDRLKPMAFGGNGSQCATCEIPPRVDRVELKVIRAERDAVAVLAALRAVDEKTQARFSSVDASLSELHRMIAELLELQRLGV
jgi:transcriptional regulator NrdR family protein